MCLLDILRTAWTFDTKDTLLFFNWRTTWTLKFQILAKIWLSIGSCQSIMQEINVTGMKYYPPPKKNSGLPFTPSYLTFFMLIHFINIHYHFGQSQCAAGDENWSLGYSTSDWSPRQTPSLNESFLLYFSQNKSVYSRRYLSHPLPTYYWPRPHRVT